MSGQFKVGDICIGQNFVNHTEYNGMECAIIGGLKDRNGQDPITGVVVREPLYDVHWANGEMTYQSHPQLRLKHPPGSAKSIMREAILKAKQPVMEPA